MPLIWKFVLRLHCSVLLPCFLSFQAKLENLESERGYKGVELEREMGRCVELQRDIAAARNALDISQGNVTSLEAEVRERKESSSFHCYCNLFLRFYLCELSMQTAMPNSQRAQSMPSTWR